VPASRRVCPYREGVFRCTKCIRLASETAPSIPSKQCWKIRALRIEERAHRPNKSSVTCQPHDTATLPTVDPQRSLDGPASPWTGHARLQERTDPVATTSGDLG